MRISRALAVAALSGLPAAAPLGAVAGGWAEEPQAAARLISAWARAEPGGDAALGLEFRLAPGWHVYWKDPGDAGYAPELDVAPEVVRVARLRFPAPERFELPGDLVAFGYDEAVIYPIDSRLAAGLEGTAPVRADLDYLVCAESCIPYRARLELDLPLGPTNEPDAEQAPRLATWRERVPRPLPAPGGPGLEQHLEPAGADRWRLELVLSGETLATASPRLFVEKVPGFELGRPQVGVSDRRVRFETTVRRIDPGVEPAAALQLHWTAAGLLWRGAAAAWEGTAALGPPSTTVRRRAAPLRVALAVVALLLVLHLIRRALRPTRTRTR